MKILLLQLFWISFAAIGLAEFIVLAKLKQTKNIGLIKLLPKHHPFVVLLMAFVTGLSTFGIIVIPGCFLEAPIVVLEVFYIVLLVASLAVLSRHTLLVKKFVNFKSESKKNPLLAFALIALIVDFIFSLHGGGQVDGDANYEIAQITLFAGQHLTLTDPIFGKYGVPPTAFSTSILHALYALATRLLHVSAAWVWFYSYAFFRLIIWISFFALSWTFLDKKVRTNWSYVVMAIVPFLYGDTFEYAELHYFIVFAWICVLIIGIKYWLEEGSLFLLIVSSILIATTHPLNALMCAAFLFILALVLAIKTRQLNRVVSLVPAVVILVLPMALYYYYPHGITQAGFSDNPLFGPTLDLKKYGSLVINLFHPDFSLLQVGAYLLIAICIYASLKLPKSKLRLALLVPVTPLVVLTYSIPLTSLVGYVYLILKARKRSIKAAILIMVLFLSLFIYDPLVLSVFVGRLPLWTLSRFQGFNMLAFIAPVIGLLCIVVLPYVHAGFKRVAALATLAVLPIFLVVLPKIDQALNITVPFNPGDQLSRQESFDTLQTLSNFKDQLSGQIVYSNDPNLPALIPAAIDANVFYINNEANANPAVNISQRRACAADLSQSLNLSNLKASGITAIITPDSSSTNFTRLLTMYPQNIHLERTAYGYSVYSVTNMQSIPVSSGSICAIKPNKS